jgi:hypothetical protein
LENKNITDNRARQLAIRSGNLTATISAIVLGLVFFFLVFKYPMGGIISLLSFPIWGLAIGIVFWLLGWACANIYITSKNSEVIDSKVTGISYLIAGALLSGIVWYSHSLYVTHIAGSINTNPSKLKQLYEKARADNDYVLYRALSRNPSTPDDVLEQLSTFSSEKRPDRLRFPREFVQERFTVQQSVAMNPSTPESVLQTLANSPERSFVARNPNASSEILRELSRVLGKYGRREVAQHLNTDSITLNALANDPASYVRYGVLMNPNIGMSQIDILLNDSNTSIRNEAQRISRKFLKR